MLDKQESKKDVMNHLSAAGDTKPKASGDLGKENTTMDDLKAELGTKKEAINVHSMPGKFVAAAAKSGAPSGSSGKKSSGGMGRKLILIAIGLILIIIIGIAGVLYFVGQNSENNANTNNNQAPVVNQNTNTNQNSNQNDNQNQNDNDNTNDDNSVTINTNDDDNQNSNQNDNQNQNDNDNTNDDNDNNNDNQSFDADNDGLSYEEELVFSTNPNLEDTDKDGYKDGQEIANLYNPLLPNADLATSGLVMRFNNNIYNYALLRPKSWLAKADNGNLAEIIVLPNSESGESFTISSIANSDSLSLNDALAANEARLGTAINFENYSLAGHSALRSRDGQNVISVKDDFIYIISHNSGALGSANFDSVFEMMINSFEWSDVRGNGGIDEDEG